MVKVDGKCQNRRRHGMVCPEAAPRLLASVCAHVFVCVCASVHVCTVYEDIIRGNVESLNISFDAIRFIVLSGILSCLIHLFPLTVDYRVYNGKVKKYIAGTKIFSL